MDKRIVRWWMCLLILGAGVLGVSIFSLCVGSAGIPLKKVVQLFFERGNAVDQAIVFGLRLPRIILGLAVGGALSLSGVILQGIFRNPLVEPYTLGISGGAALGACLGIVLRLYLLWGAFSLPLCGFAGAVSITCLVYLLSVRNGAMKVQGLLLTGVMFSLICSSLIMLLMAVSRAEDLHGIVFWVMGSLGEPDWFLVKLMFWVSVIGLILSYRFCFGLNAFSLGEEEAFHLGFDTEKIKKFLFVLASLLTGVSVSIAGIIGFVGLIVPHFMRMFTGADHRILLVSSFLCGGCFLVFCDTLARTIISPLELPVGVITGIFGGSLFVYALYRKSR